MKRLHWRAAVTFICFGMLCACSKSPAPASEQNAQWLRDGMIAISRPLPGINHSASQELLGFMPIPRTMHSGAWISLDSDKGFLSVMNGDKQMSAVAGQGFENLKPGTYQLLHKQKNALWYAPDSYFSARGLDIPAQGDRSRYRRGALGDFVLYINKDTPIYSGPVWDPEIGGVRISEDDMARLYHSVDVGSSVEIR